MAMRVATGGMPARARLARPVLDPRGAVLLAAGTRLDESTAAALARSVAYVWIETVPGEADLHDPDARSAEDALAARIEEIYARHAGKERMDILKRLSLNHLVGRPAE